MGGAFLQLSDTQRSLKTGRFQSIIWIRWTPITGRFPQYLEKSLLVNFSALKNAKGIQKSKNFRFVNVFCDKIYKIKFLSFGKLSITEYEKIDTV